MTTTHAKPRTMPVRNATCLNGEGGGCLQSVVDAVAALDLDPMKVKLMDSGEGPGWDRDTADRVEARYRQFLVLAACFGGAVPTKPIDEFWHAHILDTRKYAEDCDKAFGRFLHHFPYFGMRGEDDRRNLEAAFARTLDLVEAVFGPGARWDAVAQGGAPGTSFCSTDCSEGNCTPIPSCESVDGFSGGDGTDGYVSGAGYCAPLPSCKTGLGGLIAAAGASHRVDPHRRPALSARV